MAAVTRVARIAVWLACDGEISIAAVARMADSIAAVASMAV